MIDISNLVKQAFNTVGKVVPQAIKEVTYRHNTSAGVYDPSTGTTTFPSTSYNLSSVILVGFTFDEKVEDQTNNQRRQIEVGDMKMLVPLLDLPLTPTLSDSVTIDGEVWSVRNYKMDPTQSSLLTVHIRRA